MGVSPSSSSEQPNSSLPSASSSTASGEGNPWVFGRVAAVLETTPSGHGGEQLWSRHSSNFGANLQQQSIEILKFPVLFSEGVSTATAVGSTTPRTEGVPIMRIVGFFPGVSPRQVTQHLTNNFLRRRWDANYLAFDCIANFHLRAEAQFRKGSLFKQACPSAVMAALEGDIKLLERNISLSSKNARDVSTTVMSNSWWCWGGDVAEVSPANTVVLTSNRGQNLSSLLKSSHVGGADFKTSRITLGQSLVSPTLYPPLLLSASLDSDKTPISNRSPSSSTDTTLGLRKGFELLQHSWARHCVGSSMLERFGFAPRSFLYEMYVTRSTAPKGTRRQTSANEPNSLVEAALNEVLAYSTVYQGISFPPEHMAQGDSAVAPPQKDYPASIRAMTDGILVPYFGKGPSHSASSVPVEMNYQEVLVLPVFDAVEDKKRYLKFARGEGGSVFTVPPSVHYPWLQLLSKPDGKTESGESCSPSDDIDSVILKAALHDLQGSFMIMTACNDVKPPEYVPLWMEKAVSKFFTTGAYSMLYSGILSAIRQGE